MAERSRRVTSADVASRAGVSAGTVSHVLSGAKRVRPETRQAVEQAMAELGFRPSGIGRALARNSTASVGMLVPDITNPFFAELSLLVEHELAARGIALLLANTSGEADAERRYLEDFVERSVDGVLLVAGDATEHGLIDELSAFTPIVLVDRTVPGWSGDVVMSDAVAGAEAIAGHLAELGHRRVAHLGAHDSISTARARSDSLRSALDGHGIDLVVSTVGSFMLSEAPQRAEGLLDAPEKFTAVVADNDLLAISTVIAALRRGLDVPGDLSIVGYDDIAFAALSNPPLTTVRQSGGKIAAAATDLLVSRSAQRTREPRHHIVTPELVVRGTTGPPRRRRR